MPVIQPDEVLIQVKRIGICGSDIHAWHGLHPSINFPVVQGHEVSGLIAETGGNVKSQFLRGEKVVFIPQITCGSCFPCRNGMENICDNLRVMGFHTNGAAQEYVAVKASNVLRLPNIITLDYAALIEPISVGVHAIARAGGVEGKKVVVIGAGTIGNLLAQVALASGARSLLITDIKDYKLDKARQSGLMHAVNSRKVGLGEAIAAVLGQDKADVIFECVGSQITINEAINYARKGSTIVVVGEFGTRPEVDMGLVQDRELTVTGTLNHLKKDFERAIELAASGILHLDGIVTHRFHFRKFEDAYHFIEQMDGEYMKVMIDL
jgi:L-iditol 2-dehydrogenase